MYPVQEARIVFESSVRTQEYASFQHCRREADYEVESSKPKTALTSDFERRYTPSRVALFRFSALTFNSHKIHYDTVYTKEVEGRPGTSAYTYNSIR